jgi:hypothetical protein
MAANNLDGKKLSLSMHKLLRHAFETRRLYYLLLEIDLWKWVVEIHQREFLRMPGLWFVLHSRGFSILWLRG